MAYIGNQLSLISSGTLALFGASEGQGGMWWYANTTDSLATVTGANYISDGQQRGLSLGSLVVFWDGVASTLLYVSALQQVPPGPTENPASASFGVTLTPVTPGSSSGIAALATTAALQSASIPAADIAGADFVLFVNTGTTPGNLQLPSAAALLALFPNAQAGFSYVLEIRNASSGANTATITQDTGATITLPATNTISQNVTRQYVVTFNTVGASATATFANGGLSAAGA